jgi:DNA-binding beta-propeller fold protein YncE
MKLRRSQIPQLQTLCILFCCVLLASCGAPQSGQSPESRGASDMVITWPSSADTTRIRFLQFFATPEDLGIRPTAFRRFMDAMAGVKDTGMIRPYAISVYDQKILVGDPGMHAVHLFDRGKRVYRFITTADDEPLSSPVGVALSQDRIFVADSALGKVFILDHKGVLLTTISGLQRPTGLAFDATSNRLYVADTMEHRIAVFDVNGQALFDFGQRGIAEGEFNFPSHIFLSNGRLLVNDNMNFRIQTFDTDGRFLSSFGTHGDGSGAFSQPKGVAADSDGNVYVAGATIDRVQVFSQQGEFLLAFGSKGVGAGEFVMPTGVTIVDDRIYVADSYNRRIQVFQYVGGDQDAP